MSDLKSVIESTEKELAKAKAKRDKAQAKDLVSLDKEIIRLQLRVQRLKESEQLQRDKAQGNEPTDTLTRAKVFVTDTLASASENGKDINSDPTVTASLRTSDLIERLELLQMASATSDTAPIPDTETYTAQFEKFITAKIERIEKARKQITDLDSEIERIETALSDSTSAGNAQEIIEYSDSLETAKRNREYLLPMLTEQENSETFPPETFGPVWKEICDTYRSELELRLEIIRTAQSIHDIACHELTEMLDRLGSIRYSMQSLARENGSKENITENRPQLTQGIDTEWLRVSKDLENNRVYSAIYRNRSKAL